MLRLGAALFISLSILPSFCSAEMVVQACFSPQGKCSAHILREIDQAKKELLVAVYAFTNDELAGALVVTIREPARPALGVAGCSLRVGRSRDAGHEQQKQRGQRQPRCGQGAAKRASPWPHPPLKFGPNPGLRPRHACC